MTKKRLVLLNFLVLVVYGIGCDTPDPVPVADDVGDSEIRLYEVLGMDCPGCHGGVEKLVKKIPSVQQAEANWEKKQMAVTVIPGAELDDEDIYDAIRRANFTPGKRIK